MAGSIHSPLRLVRRGLAAAAAVALAASAALAQNDMRVFVTRSGDKLMEGDREYRFVSFNIPNLHLVEDDFRFDATNEWRFPDEYEIADALTSVKQLGGRAVRIYVISVCRPDGPNPIPCHVVRPGEFNEEAFRALDKVLEVANRVGVRVVIPLVDEWKWWGGIAEYAAFRGKPADAFWTDPEIIGDYERTVSYVLNRRNTYTGMLYKDDKAILAWETGNELACPYSWTKQVAAFIKANDPNHLVWDGLYIGSHDVEPKVLEDPNVDVVSSHHYPDADATGDTMARDIAAFRRATAGKKAYVVGEFGFIPVSGAEKVLDAAIANGLSGAMIWSLRFHDRDGGFYWHSEGASGDAVKAYHFPGFATGDAYGERAVFALLRAKAAEIRGVPVPAIERPAPPVLLPIGSAAEISWRGSAGADGYDVERATAPGGPWTVVGMDVDDTRVQYRPLFSDEFAEPGHAYFYRVRAKNAAGASEPSNAVGPVRVTDSTLVDEMGDFMRVFARGGAVALESAHARPYKEDATRLAGGPGAWIMYRTLGQLGSADVLAFSERDGVALEFYASDDGTHFTKVEATVSRYPTAVNPYGYTLPVRYEVSGFPPGAHLLKIVFRGASQIGRVAVRHAGGAR